MNVEQMLGQSGILTLLGMGVVFSFLVIMIVCMYLLQAILHALKLDKDAPAKTASASAAPSVPAAPQADQKAVVAAIAAALKSKGDL